MTPPVLAAVFGASLLGSLHCFGMCGGFVGVYAAGAPKGAWGHHVTYSLGRLLTYVMLGVLAGTLGSAVDFAVGGRVAAVVAGLLIVAWGGVLLAQTAGWSFGGRAPSWMHGVLARVLPRLAHRPPIVRALILGMASTALPCGWLYSFAASAAGTGSAEGGALLMAAFWAGTVPAMLGAGFGFQRLGRLLGPKLGVLMPVALIVVGLFTIVQRTPMSGSAPQETVQHVCH